MISDLKLLPAVDILHFITIRQTVLLIISIWFICLAIAEGFLHTYMQQKPPVLLQASLMHRVQRNWHHWLKYSHTFGSPAGATTSSSCGGELQSSYVDSTNTRSMHGWPAVRNRRGRERIPVDTTGGICFIYKIHDLLWRARASGVGQRRGRPEAQRCTTIRFFWNRHANENQEHTHLHRIAAAATTAVLAVTVATELTETMDMPLRTERALKRARIRKDLAGKLEGISFWNEGFPSKRWLTATRQASCGKSTGARGGSWMLLASTSGMRLEYNRPESLRSARMDQLTRSFSIH